MKIGWYLLILTAPLVLFHMQIEEKISQKDDLHLFEKKKGLF